MAAVGSTTGLNVLMLNIFFGLSVGVNVLTARYKGARQRREVSRTVHTSTAVALYGGIVMGAIGILISKPMLILMAIMAIISLILTFTARSFVKGVINQAGLGQTTSYASGDSDNSSLGELSNLIEDVEALGVDMSGIGGLIDGVSAMNNDMESANSGWPSSLRAYPAGSATALTSYRTQISGTTLEEMHSYINALKGDGFAFKDFYDFGLSESDMLSANGWWGTDGKLYLSMTWSDNTLVIDHTTTLPDLSSYF